MATEKTILFLSNDQGGIQTVIPVANTLKETAGFNIIKATSKATSLRNPGNDWSVTWEHFEDDVVQKLVTKFKPDLVITGTSFTGDEDRLTPEQKLVLACKEQKIKTISILDYWGFYRERFSTGSSSHFDLLPDFICALDVKCKNDLVGLGVSPQQVLVTHNPFFDHHVEIRKHYEDRSGSGQAKILFCSQPLAQKGWKKKWGFDQFDVFKRMYEATRSIDTLSSVRIDIWLHPKESEDLWNEMGSLQNVFLTRRQSLQDILGYSSLVSCYSTVIFESLHLDVPTLTLLPNAECSVELVTNHYGLTRFLWDLNEISKVLAQAMLPSGRESMSELRKSKESEGCFFSKGDGTDKVIQLINTVV